MAGKYNSHNWLIASKNRLLVDSAKDIRGDEEYGTSGLTHSLPNTESKLGVDSAESKMVEDNFEDTGGRAGYCPTNNRADHKVVRRITPNEKGLRVVWPEEASTSC